MTAEIHTHSSTVVSKILNRRAYTKLGLFVTLFVGVGVSTLLISLDGSFVASLPRWFDTYHWLTSVIRVGLFLAALTVFYWVRLHSIQSQNRAETLTERTQLKARIQQLVLWFAGFELLFGQALLARILEFLFT